MATKLTRIAWLSSKDHNKEFKHIIHHVNKDHLLECFHDISGNRAAGVDRQSKDDYEDNLNSNITSLVERMKTMSYRPAPVRGVEIPKDNGGKRKLGISNFEDKLIQKAMANILCSIYDPIFMKNSYGFRPNKSCHMALRDLTNYLFKSKTKVVIDVDLANYFDSISHELIIKLLSLKIKDKTFLRYIVRMLKAGVLTKGEQTRSEFGTPQGSIISPILANIVAHYVIDDWFENVVKTHCKGAVELFRYADDMVICCEQTSDSIRVKEALAKRLQKFQLAMNMDKSKLIRFSYVDAQKGKKQGIFRFLGFLFYIGKSKTGRSIPKLKTCGKRLRSKLKNINDWLKRSRSIFDILVLWERFNIRVSGHIQYFGVSHNYSAVNKFTLGARKLAFKWLNRRSQRKSFTWEEFKNFIKVYPTPRAKVVHPLW